MKTTVAESKVANCEDLPANAGQVLRARYLRRNEDGSVTETAEELFARVAHSVASAEALLGNGGEVSQWEEKFYHLLRLLEFLPNSPTLMNAGTPLGQLSACFVLPVPDTLEGIFEALKQMALIQRSGGGTGFSFSRLRPKGDPLASSGGASSGPVSFMKIFDCATENVRHGGRRRGANMAVLRVDHPDILEFVRAKAGGRALQNFNLSVGVTGTFMEEVRQAGRFPLIHPRTGRAIAQMDACQLFDEIVAAAWQTGDPGLLFLDTINRPTRLLSWARSKPRIHVASPASAYESCNLDRSTWPDAEQRRSSSGAGLGQARRRFTWRCVSRQRQKSIAIRSRKSRECRAQSKDRSRPDGFCRELIRLAFPTPERGDCLGGAAHDLHRPRSKTASTQLARKRGSFELPQSGYARNGVRLRNATCSAIV
jgi:ribonucleoside-diphosphate reductase alpha chain